MYKRQVDKSLHEPDFTADKLTLRRYDLSGKTQYILVADRMIHYKMCIRDSSSTAPR